MTKYKRIILKISGETLAENGFGISPVAVGKLVSQLKTIHEMGVQIGIVVGGGNFWRGRQGEHMDKSTADHMGMLATVINALALQDALEAAEIPVRVQTSIKIEAVAEPFIFRKAMKHLEDGKIVIFACGTGSPYFTTDTAAALRAAQLHADILLCAKNIDGVYDSDPRINKKAVKYSKISYIDYIKQGLQVLDTTAISMCMENNIPILVFGKNENNSIVAALDGESVGTIIQ